MPQTDYRRKDEPVYSWRWKALTVWIVLFTAAVVIGLVWIRTESQNRSARDKRFNDKLELVGKNSIAGLKRADFTACVENHLLITKILLRTVGMNYVQYKENPTKARKTFRAILLGNPVYKDHPELVEKAVAQTFGILKLADPAECKIANDATKSPHSSPHVTTTN